VDLLKNEQKNRVFTTSSVLQAFLTTQTQLSPTKPGWNRPSNEALSGPIRCSLDHQLVQPLPITL
jgi:hypothetical protein